MELITFAAHVGCGVHGGIDITATAQELLYSGTIAHTYTHTLATSFG